MDMQEFYHRLFVKPEGLHQRRLQGLTRVTRTQIMDATREGTWLFWWKPETTPG